MNKMLIGVTLTAAALGGAIYFTRPSHPQASTVAPARVAPAVVATIARPAGSAQAPLTSGPELDSDVGTVPTPAATMTPAWAPVPTTAASGGTVVKVSSSGAPRGSSSIGKVDPRSVDSVTKAFATSAFVVDALVDQSPQAGFARAAVWASDGYRPYLVAAPAGGRGDRWHHLQEIQGWTAVTASPTTVGDKPADTATSTTRAFQVDIVTHGNDSSVEQEKAYVIVTCAQATGGVWKVTGYQQLT